MPTIPQFDPPAGLMDFNGIAEQRAAWDEFIALSFQRNIEQVETEVGAGKSQFYNPKVSSTDPPVATDVIRWKGFPLLIAAKHPGNKKAAWAEADQLRASGDIRTVRARASMVSENCSPVKPAPMSAHLCRSQYRRRLWPTTSGSRDLRATTQMARG